MTANDTINVALIGCRGMGWADLCAMMQNPGVQLLALCDEKIIIPMTPGSESLNAAVAASILMWETAR